MPKFGNHEACWKITRDSGVLKRIDKICVIIGWLNFWVIAANAEIFITNNGQSDGFGSQFQGLISTVIYADLHQKQFAYTPFRIMEHNYDRDPEFIAKKEKLINFIGSFPIADIANNIKKYLLMDHCLIFY